MGCIPSAIKRSGLVVTFITCDDNSLASSPNAPIPQKEARKCNSVRVAEGGGEPDVIGEQHK